MLTTSQIIRNATSSLWPLLLILIGWYAIAVSLRALGEFFYRFFRRRMIQTDIGGLPRPLLHPPAVEKLPIHERSQSKALDEYLHHLQDKVEDVMLRTQRADSFKLWMLFIEGALFTLLALVCMYLARDMLGEIRHFWWLHLLGPLLFLCFLLRARRILLLVPLSLLAWVSWEIFAFIGSFEKTLEATSEIASVEILEKKPDPKGQKLKIRLSFPNQLQREITLFANEKLYLEGRVFRVSTDVLLFGGRNLASVERIFSDSILPKEAISLLDAEQIPPRYRWKDYEKSFRAELRKRFAYFLWKQLFSLKQYANDKTTEKTPPLRIQFLEAAICSPTLPGRRFSLRLRNVGGLECHPN